MISTNILTLILICHFIGDFLLQPRYIAESKHKDIGALLFHCFIYLFPLSILGFALTETDKHLFPNATYGIANFCLHFLVDYCTSKLNVAFYKKQYMTLFWWCIGFDQLLHISFLVLTYNLWII